MLEDLKGLSNEDLNDLIYFWSEKSDLERWIGWAGMKIKAPAIWSAWRRYKETVQQAEWTINGMIEEIKRELYSRD